MRVKVFLIVGLLLSVSFNALAVEIGSKVIDVEMRETFVSRYIWRGQDLYADNDGGLFHNLDFSSEVLGGVLGLNLWGANSLSGGHEDGEEYDYTLSYSKDYYEGKLSVSEGVTYFDFPNTTSRADVIEPWIGLTLNKIPELPIYVSLILFAGYDFQGKSGGPDEGWYYSWGFETEIPFTVCPKAADDQTLVIGIVNWGHDGVGDMEPNALYATEINLSTGYEVGEYSLSPSIHYVVGYEELINAGDDEIWFGLELGRNF